MALGAFMHISAVFLIGLLILPVRGAAGAQDSGHGVPSVFAVAETHPVADGGDAADDPAIWIHPDDPALSLVLGTNKQRGIGLYDLSGALVAVYDHGMMNNVDVRQGVQTGAGPLDLAAATNRTARAITFYRVDTSRRALIRLEPDIPVDYETPYGLCLYHSAAGALYVFAGDNVNAVAQWRLNIGGDFRVTAEKVREFVMGSETEGCVADDAAGSFFLAEEDVGLWKFGAEPHSGTSGSLIDTVSDGRLTADVEGLAIYDEGAGTGYLIVSSQGSNSYAVYDRAAPHAFRGHFAIESGPGGIDGTSDTDGIEVVSQALGPAFPQGLFVAQDGENTGPAGNQNFKLVPWDQIRMVLRLP